MIILNWPRQSGKTTYLLQSLGPEDALIVADEPRRKILLKMRDKLGLKFRDDQIVAVGTWSRNRRWKRVYIDELDDVIFALLGGFVDEATMTGIIQRYPAYRPLPNPEESK